MSQTEFSLSTDIAVPHRAEWPEWHNVERPWAQTRGILKRPSLAGYVWISDTYAHPESDYAERFGLAWCCVVVAAARVLGVAL